MRFPKEIQEAVVVLTRKCNHGKCYYCNVEKNDRGSKPNSQKVAAFLNYLPLKNIRFFGGEPLTSYKKLVEVSKKLKDKKITLNSNGLLLDDNKISWLKDNKINLILSWDGDDKDLINNRRYTVKDVVKLNQILDELKPINNQVQINLTVSPISAENLSRNFEKIINRGFSRINILPVFYSIWTIDRLRKLRQELNQVAEIINSNQAIKLVNLNNYHDVPLFKNSLVVDQDGKLYLTTAVLEKFYSKNRDNIALTDISRTNPKIIRDLEDIQDKIKKTNSDVRQTVRDYIKPSANYSTYIVNQAFENFIKKLV